jgi:hypothetical protein
MKRFTYAVVFPCLSLALATLMYSRTTAHSERQRNLQVGRPPTFQDVWQAHGAAEIFANLRSYELEFDRITWVSPTHFFERQARLSVEDGNFFRVLSDSMARKFESSVLNSHGSFHEEMRRPGHDGTLLTQEQPVDEERVRAFRFSVQICSLLPILRMCAQPETEITFVQRTPAMLNEFKVRSPDAEIIVYADQSHLIRRVDIRRATLQFAGYRTSEGESVRLPYLERVSIGDRLVYEFVFTRIDVKP